MKVEPTDFHLIQMYRDWWKDSYGLEPNNQNAIIAAAWARHVLNVIAEPAATGDSDADVISDYYMQLQAQQGSDKCVYHPAKEQASE